MRKPPTINDVAVALGMHKSTVSLALSGKGTLSAETRQRVFAAAQEMGYEPNAHAQRLAQGQSGTAVCLYSTALDVGLATEKILRVQQALNACALEVPIYTGYVAVPPAEQDGESTTGKSGNRENTHAETQAKQMRQICRLRPRVLIFSALNPHPMILRELEVYQRGGGNIVTYDTPNPLTCDKVIFDRDDNAYRAAKHLLEQGHRRIGFGISVAGNAPHRHEPTQAARRLQDPQAQRLTGFLRALDEYGLSLPEAWFFRTSTYEQGGAEMARLFLQLRDRPTALAIVNDYVAMAFMVELIRAGVRIPQDLSIIGHDNQPIAVYCPVPLTTMTQPVEEIVRSVADLALNHLETDPPTAPRTLLLRGDLVQRASVMGI